MALKNYYLLLELAPSSSHDEIKRAFRLQIARYHPDKVQHLGKEFQEMAAERAAELTEAYRILSDEGRRAEYDRAFSAEGAGNGAHRVSDIGASAAAPPASAPADTAPDPSAPPPANRAPADRQSPRGAHAQPSQAERFTEERASRDEFVRKATVGRFRQALEAAGGYDESQVSGFDIACVPKGKLFARKKGPRLLGRFVSRVDADAVGEAWTQAAKWTASGDEICVFLMGAAIAPPAELAGAIAEQRRKPTKGIKVTLIPIDARDWAARMPTDAPAIAKDLLTRLKRG